MRLWLRCVLLFILSALPVFAGVSSPLEEAPRLQSPVTLRATMLPIPQVLREIGKETGVPLECTKSISEDKMTVLVRDCPAWKVLEKMAEVMGYSWEKTKTGYRLTQSARSAQEEAQALLEEQSALREEVQQFIRDAVLIAQRDYPEIVREYLAILKGEESLSVEGDPERLSQRLRILTAVTGVDGYLFARLCRLLTPQMWQTFWNGDVIVASNIPGTQWLPLPENVSEWRRVHFEIDRYWMSHITLEDGEPLLPPGVEPSPPEAKPSTQYLFAFRLDWGAGEIRTNLAWRDDNKRFSNQQRPIFESDDGNEDRRSGALWRRWEGWQTPEEARKDAPLCQKPIGRQEGKKDSSTAPLPFVDSRKTMADYLQWLFEHAQVNIVADAFRYPVGGGEMPVAGEEKTVDEWISRLAKDADSAYLFGWWRVEDDFLLFRHHRYWWLRQSEPSENQLKAMEERYAKRSITLDDYARLAKSLTPAQEGRLKRGLLVAQFDATPFGEITESNLPALRFWGSLSPVQQRNALAGKPLRVDSLPPAVQQLFWQAVGYGLVHASEVGSLPEPASFFPQVAVSLTSGSKYLLVGEGGWSSEDNSVEQFWNHLSPLMEWVIRRHGPPSVVQKFENLEYSFHFVFSATDIVGYHVRLRIPEETRQNGGR